MSGHRCTCSPTRGSCPIPDECDLHAVPAPAADNGRGMPYGRSVYISAPWDGREVPPPPDPGEVERVARAMRVTRECQAGMAFGVPPDARDQFITALARAALAAARPATDAEQKVARVEALAEDGVFDVREWGERGTPFSNGAAKAFRRIRAALSGAHTEPKEQG